MNKYSLFVLEDAKGGGKESRHLTVTAMIDCSNLQIVHGPATPFFVIGEPKSSWKISGSAFKSISLVPSRSVKIFDAAVENWLHIDEDSIKAIVLTKAQEEVSTIIDGNFPNHFTKGINLGRDPDLMHYISSNQIDAVILRGLKKRFSKLMNQFIKTPPQLNLKVTDRFLECPLGEPRENGKFIIL